MTGIKITEAALQKAASKRSFSMFPTEQPTSQLPICDYCNNPVASGKHVHERCVERFDEREEQNDQDQRENI